MLPILRWRRGGVLRVALFALMLGAIVPAAASRNAPHLRIEADAIHVLAIGSCPPWRPIFNDCARDVAAFTEAVRERMGVPDSRVMTLVDAQATATAVRQAFEDLHRRLPSDAVLITYYVGHGTLLPTDGGAHDETFVLWSSSPPFAALDALQKRIWMTSTELGGLIAALPVRAALVILDTCHALGAQAGLTRRTESVLEGVAVMASSLADERSWADAESAVFTRSLVAALRSGASTLHEAFLLARARTSVEAAAVCAASDTPELCTPQDPILVDPAGITRRLLLTRGG